MPTANHFREPFSIGQWCRRILMGGALLLVLLFAGARLNLRRGINLELERIRAAGQPVTVGELNQRYHDLGGRPDGSESLQLALAKFAEVSSRLETNGIPGTTNTTQSLLLFGPGKTTSLRPDQGLPTEMGKTLAKALTELGPALDNLGQVTSPTDMSFRHPIQFTNGIATMLPHLSPLTRAAKWNTLRSVHALDSGDAEGAFRASIDTLRLSRTLEPEPMLISQVLRFAMVKAAISSIERLLTFKSLSRVQTERMRSELRQAQPDRAIHLAMQGERCLGLDAMLFKPQPSVVIGLQVGPNVEIGLGLRVAMQLYRMSGFADRDVKFYLGPMNAAVAAGTNSVRNRVAFATDGNTFPPRSQSQFYIFSSMLLPALERAFVKEAECLTALAAADAALAVEAFRADNSGRLPGSLRELVPAYFAEIPIDPATERPLALVPGAVGYAIHANGPVFSVRR